MQFRITKILNKLMIFISALSIVFIVLYIVFCIKNFDFKNTFLFVGVTMIIISMILYWLLDSWLDKILIEKMIKNKKVAIANIKKSRNLKRIADSTFRSYQLFEIEIEIICRDGSKEKATYVERFDIAQNIVPAGTVFITYDKTRPQDISLVPNLLIANHLELKDIVDEYEKRGDIDIKYLNVEYRKGFLVSTMKEYYYNCTHNEKKKRNSYE